MTADANGTIYQYATIYGGSVLQIIVINFLVIAVYWVLVAVTVSILPYFLAQLKEELICRYCFGLLRELGVAGKNVGRGKKRHRN